MKEAPVDRETLAQMIDYTVLRPEATVHDVVALCEDATRRGVYAVCVSPSMVMTARQALAVIATKQDRDPSVKICTVVGFPSGAVTPQVKAFETTQAIMNGAEEIDMVINLGFAKAGDWDAVEHDIHSVRTASMNPRAVLKVIIESAALTDEEIVRACIAAERAGADFVKTSTGFNPAGGATVHAIQLMKETVGDRLGIKASGGVKTYELATELIAAGATRIGLSALGPVLDNLA